MEGDVLLHTGFRVRCGPLGFATLVTVARHVVANVAVVANLGGGTDDLTDLRRSLERPRAEVVALVGEARLRREAEERGGVLHETVGEADRQDVDVLWGDVQRDRAGLLVIGPHVRVGVVLDAVDRHAVDALGVEGRAGVVVSGENDLSVGVDHGGSRLAGARDAVVLDVGVDDDVEGGLGGTVLRRVHELDAGAECVEGALLVIRGVGLGHVHEAGRLVHDEAVEHVRVGVVLGGVPVGELRPLDVGTDPSHIVVGVGVGLEEDGIADAVGEHGVPVVGEAVAVVVGPEAVEGGVGELTAIDHGGRNVQHVPAGKVLALAQLADVLRVHVLADVLLDARDVAGALLLHTDGFHGGGASRTVLVEGGGHGHVAVHREGGLAVLDLDVLRLLVRYEDRESVCEVALVRRNADGDLAADLDALGHLVRVIKREGAVLRRHERDGRRLGRLRSLRHGGEGGREGAERRARDDRKRDKFARDSAVTQTALDALDSSLDSFHQNLLSVIPVVPICLREVEGCGGFRPVAPRLPGVVILLVLTLVGKHLRLRALRLADALDGGRGISHGGGNPLVVPVWVGVREIVEDRDCPLVHGLCDRIGVAELFHGEEALSVDEVVALAPQNLLPVLLEPHDLGKLLRGHQKHRAPDLADGDGNLGAVEGDLSLTAAGVPVVPVLDEDDALAVGVEVDVEVPVDEKRRALAAIRLGGGLRGAVELLVAMAPEKYLDPHSAYLYRVSGRRSSCTSWPARASAASRLVSSMSLRETPCSFAASRSAALSALKSSNSALTPFTSAHGLTSKRW